MEPIGIDFLQKLKGKSILMYLSSCRYKDEQRPLPHDFIILNSKSFGLKISLFVGIQDGRFEGENHECINS